MHALLAAAVACSGSASSAIAPSLTAPAAPTPAPTPAPTVTFSIDMPMEGADAANESGGVNPFGVHIADHGVDGHPGWDLQYRIGASVRAAADGRVQTVMQADPQRPSRFVVQIMHEVGTKGFRTVYFGVESPRPEIVVGTMVRRGDPIGLAGVLTQMIGTGLITSAGIHFQLDDFSYTGGLTNQNAVSPENWLTASGRAVFDSMWTGASYTGELTEPFPSNPRDATFPVTRRWTRQSGGLAPVIEITRATGTTNSYTYRELGANGETTGAGTIRLTPWTKPYTTIDFMPSGGGSPRLGLYDVLNTTMRLVLGPPGAARPASFAGESMYTTTGSSSM
jgi:hypothetical protein